jgi:hypothetical protein
MTTMIDRLQENFDTATWLFEHRTDAGASEVEAVVLWEDAATAYRRLNAALEKEMRSLQQEREEILREDTAAGQPHGSGSRPSPWRVAFASAWRPRARGGARCRPQRGVVRDDRR